MNTNLHSQQTRRRKSVHSLEEKSKTKDSSSRRGEASDNNMLFQSNENHSNISVNPKRVSKHSFSKRQIVMSSRRRAQHPGFAEEGETGVIVTPRRNDILCGRGGSINSHPGNVVFREWIHERKEEYNLADTKSAKTQITNDIFERIKSLEPPGRFLHKRGSNNLDNTWSEVDDTKALAKISQCLREGAPAFRAAHGKGRKPRRSLQLRRHSSSGASQTDHQPRPRSKRHKSTSLSPTFETASQRADTRADFDVSPPYLDDAAGTNFQDIDNFNSLFNHNHLQNNRNLTYASAGFAEGIAYEGSTGTECDGSDRRFDQLKPLNPHPLVNICDYHASISDVANAIPPATPQTCRPRVASFTTPDSLPALQYEQFDPCSFLPPIPNNNKTEATNSSMFRREHSLSFSESDLPIDEEFTNPFADDELTNQQIVHQDTRDRDRGSSRMSYTLSNHPFPSSLLTPTERGLSFEDIGSIPTGHYIRKSDIAAPKPDADVGYRSHEKKDD